jgi:hypothetical protein
MWFGFGIIAILFLRSLANDNRAHDVSEISNLCIMHWIMNLVAIVIGIIYVTIYSIKLIRIPVYFISLAMVGVLVNCIVTNITLQTGDQIHWLFRSPQANLMVCAIINLGALIALIVSEERMISGIAETLKIPIIAYSGWMSGSIVYIFINYQSVTYNV